MAAAPTFYVVPGSSAKSIIDDNIKAAIELVEDLERQGIARSRETVLVESC